MAPFYRRLAIVEALCERRYEKRENLAFEFNVCVRTISYDIRMLSERFPIYSFGGSGGGIFIVDGYRLGKKYLTDLQAATLEEIRRRCSPEEQSVIDGILNDLKKPDIAAVKKR